MSKRDKLRRIKHLMYKHKMAYALSKEQAEKALAEWLDLEYYSIARVNDVKEVLEIYDLSEKLKLSKKVFINMWHEISIERYENEETKQLKPQKETKDNKKVHVGSGGSNHNKIRYPSKKRSLRVWKNFYKLFPSAAEADGWNGKTSKRINKWKKR